MPTVDFHIASAADDGGGWKTGGSYPPTGSYNVDDGGICYSIKNAASFEVDVGLFRWDTSSIPDAATIVSAEVEFLVTALLDADSRVFEGEWYDFGGEPSVDADWVAERTQTRAFTINISAMTNDTREAIPIVNVGNINKTGYTGIRTTISGGQPTGSNQVAVIAYENGTNPGEEAILRVTYSEAAGAPEKVRTVRSSQRWV